VGEGVDVGEVERQEQGGVIQAPPPCRLFFILARKAPVGVVFRRGPSKWVQVIRWDTRTDAFEAGQWFHGRIYEKRCDLSPDGTKLLYFAQKINARTMSDPDYTYAWTAVSKIPYLTALALWPKGDCWHGGGLFEDDRTIWLNHRPNVAHPHRNHEPPKRVKVAPNPEAYGEDGPVFYRRLERDGWVMRQEWSGRHVFMEGFKTDSPFIFELAHPSVPISLHMTGSFSGYEQVFDFAVVRKRPRAEFHIGNASWAEWDPRGRLVYASNGKLFSMKFSGVEEPSAKELADFNATRPEPRAAPPWAKKW
jgi:hypothetical protein